MRVSVELRLSEWARWRLCGTRGIGYPRSSSFTRSEGGGGERDYSPDCDMALRCMDVQEAIGRVGGDDKKVIYIVYLSHNGIGNAARLFNVSRRTIYNRLDRARERVWEELKKV